MSYPGEDIAALTLDRAKFIYRRDFWQPARCDQMPDILRFDLFVRRSIRASQRPCAWCSAQPASRMTGVIGPVSLAAIAAYEPYRLLLHFSGERLDYLNDFSSWPSFGRGWTQRIANNMRRIK